MKKQTIVLVFKYIKNINDCVDVLHHKKSNLFKLLSVGNKNYLF